MHYPRPLINKIVKTSIVEFYWLNNFKNQYYKQENLTKVSICNCTTCKFLETKNSKKMIAGNEKPILFGNIFALFYFYWNYNVDRMQQQLSEEEASKLQNSVFSKLSSTYQKISGI